MPNRPWLISTKSGCPEESLMNTSLMLPSLSPLASKAVA